jgi:predicted aspartyl protease
MDSWDYVSDIPFVYVRVFGKDVSVNSIALVDTGAKYCVLHEKLVRALKLEAVGDEALRGFGGRGKFQAALVNADVELAGKRHNITFASVSNAHFPMVAPKIVLGRNLLNLFKITLDGPRKKITIE